MGASPVVYRDGQAKTWLTWSGRPYMLACKDVQCSSVSGITQHRCDVRYALKLGDVLASLGFQ